MLESFKDVSTIYKNHAGTKQSTTISILEYLTTSERYTFNDGGTYIDIFSSIRVMSTAVIIDKILNTYGYCLLRNCTISAIINSDGSIGCDKHTQLKCGTFVNGFIYDGTPLSGVTVNGYFVNSGLLS